MEDYLTIKNFSHELPFLELVQLLREHEIPYQTEVYRERLNPISMITLSPEFIVKVPPNRFSQVDGLLLDIAADEVLLADADHYLFDFRDEELFDILASPDEWSAFDYQLSRRILSDRGLDVDSRLLDLLKKSRIQELAQPKAKQTANIWFGYALALLGGIVGLFWGWNMATSRKILPNGDRLYVFGPSDRQHGWRIMAISTVILILLALWARADFLTTSALKQIGSNSQNLALVQKRY